MACGNDAAPGSGSGCANSTGLGALLSASGSTSVTADDLVLIASQLPDSQFGILFMGPGQTSPLPFGDGLLCITPTSGQQLQEGLWRFPVTSSGSAGTITLGPGVVGYSSSNFGASGQILSGHTWNFQGWFRDPQGPCGGSFSLSNGMKVTFGP